MPKITFDVSGSDPDKAVQDVEPPKPGVYKCKIAEINPGFSKNDDGKPDKSRPRLEVVYRVQDKQYLNAPLWDYLSFSEAAQWKLDQFLQAVGIANKKKRKGSFDPAKLIGKTVKVRVQGEGSGDNYRARVRSVFALAAKDADEDDEDIEDEDDIEEEEDEEEEDEVDEETEDEDDEDEDEDEESEEEDLEELGTVADAGKPKKDAVAAQTRLEELAEEAGLDPDEYDTWTELAGVLAADADEDPF